ncbi:hypothetical protein H257_09106 [Aphanomyces astaci]|uniref:Uncharacterized protein n=1 Tax=Aphanomyces astaci TaxID=112090 RepID=W4GDS7_APHAT|nr:hypothetical protein H257_09106 [Aphanomyces astaci]ETV77219.1 hypothetical protein H257_09106 [Aphanomyces astaci]|eukprot:XP_009833525.1 hypothetical protein H257_09106 [Aphanomyces astaci]
MLAAEKSKTLFFTVPRVGATDVSTGVSTVGMHGATNDDSNDATNDESNGVTNDHSSGTINVESIALADYNNVEDVRMKLDAIQRICEKAMATSANNACNSGFVNTVLQLLTPTKTFMDKVDEIDNMRKRHRTNATTRNELRRYEPPHP